MAKRKLTFEEAIERVEEISESLERENVALDESIELYKEGLKLLAFCKERLDFAEGEISLLVNKDGNIEEEAFVVSKE